MPAALVVSGSAGSTDTTSASVTLDTTGANKITLYVSSSDATGTITDSKGNTYTERSSNVGSVAERIFDSQDSPTVGSGHTIGITGSTYPSVAVLAFSGAASSAFDQQNSGSSSVSTTVSSGSVTPSEDNEIVVSSAHGYANTSMTCDVGTVVESVPFSSGQHWSLFVSYVIQTTAAAVNATFTGSSGLGFAMAACIATFKAAAGAPAGQPFAKRLGGVPYMAGFRNNHGVRRW